MHIKYNEVQTSSRWLGVTGERVSAQKSSSSLGHGSKLRGRIVAYRDCGLSFRKIGSRVGRNQTTAMRICDGWMQEGTTNGRDRLQPPQCTTSREDRQIVRMAVTDRSITSRTVVQNIESVTHHSVSARTIRRRLRISLQHHDGRIQVWRHRGERMLNSCVMHRHTGPASYYGMGRFLDITLALL
ncbi:transposable element Tcb1 transposase [Trichonephila clavipes]|nr:transposable element Tcb1 transposase [Trichonephila clavipes]